MTINRRDLVGVALIGGLMSSPLKAAIGFAPRKGNFDITLAGGGITPVFVDAADWPGVRRAAKDLAEDIGRVTGTPAALVSDAATLPRQVIIVGTIGRSPLIDRLIASGRLDATGVRDMWEAFAVQTVANPLPGVAEALVIMGSDKRGTIYGAYDLSRMIGVSPWYWWADVPVTRQSHLGIARGRYVEASPAVRYRGIFLNDEAPCLTGWTTEKFGGMNAAFYGRLFELLLRLRANYLWPAMWNNAFAIDDPKNAPLADEYGIVMGTSHHEPMMRAHKEWTSHRQDYGNGQWNYATNREGVARFFEEGIARNRDKEVVVTVGMRGDGDVALESTGGLQSDIRLLETVIADQRRIIAKGMGRPAEQVPQVWVLFTEVYKYYDGGLRLPDDVTLMLADDNVGNLRRLPGAAERKRRGGFGVYFHMDMHGGPFAYQWINSNPLPKIWEQMNLANVYGANEMWIANVGDLKPLELPVEFFLAMAWRPSSVDRGRIASWTRDWAARQFGPDNATEIAQLVARYGKYNAMPKPEQLRTGTFSIEHDREAERVDAAWTALVARADRVNQRLRPDQRDAFYQLVLFPIRASANAAQLQIAAARNARFAQQARASTRDEAAEVRRRFRYDHELRDTYNHVMAGGKWNHMMDQTHIGYFDWYPPETDIMPAVADIDLDGATGFGVAVEGSSKSWPGYYLPPELPVIDSVSGRGTYFEVFPRGTGPAAVSVSADQPWVTIRETDAFSISRRDRRYLVDIDWAKAPVGRSSAKIMVKGDHSVTIRLTALRATAEQERAAQGAFGGLSGRFAVPVTGHARNIPVDGVGWAPIPDYGWVEAAMSVFPVDAPSFHDPRRSPRLEYDVFLAEAGKYRIDLITGPTLEVIPGRQLSIAVGLDDQPPQIATVFTPRDRENQDFLGAAHAVNAARNARIMSVQLTADRPGRHTLTLAMIDPTLVLQAITISKAPPPSTFFAGAAALVFPERS
ncbi:glycosyl hydrolase 115 family protein [Sphingomonas sp. NPDC019816]|uniref:glycosyl hydrolase 115 family protein n=1 Tax=Sphingomonas sp. NPDC019816 TaxID=3390679 RepID=UPI003CFF0D41